MIYIATHKKFEVPQLTGYMPIHVGALGKESLGYMKDSDGIEISEKNPNYCELTGLYWIWKNSKEPTKGLVHYRRYFGVSNLSRSYSDIFSHQKMESMLVNADIVLPYIENFKQNAKDELMQSCCTNKIFYQLRDVIGTIEPDYINDFDVFFTGNKATLFNMMFCRADVFDAYCDWLFRILFELEKVVNMSKLNKYQQRLYGFLSERLLNIWVMHNGLKCVYTPVVNTEMSLLEGVSILRRRLTNDFIYKIRTLKTRIK